MLVYFTTPVELWAGFVGLNQNDKTFGLKPEIGWMIRKQDNTINTALLAKLKKQATSTTLFSGIMIRAKTVPPELLQQ